MTTRTVWKSTLKVTDVQDIEMPAESVVRLVAEQYGDLCVWFECDPSKPRMLRRFYIFGTGHDIPGPEMLKWEASVVTNGGLLVWHIYTDLFPGTVEAVE